MATRRAECAIIHRFATEKPTTGAPDLWNHPMSPSSIESGTQESKVAARSYSQHSDGELIDASKRGDVAAFELLFARYQKRVFNLIYRMVGNEHDAADLTQEVFLRVYKSLERLRSDEALLGWLRTIAVNITRDHFRKSARTIRGESLDKTVKLEDGEVEREVEDWSANPERLFGRKDIQEAVQRAIDTLSEDHRTVVALHHIEGVDVRDIAKMLKVPSGTVKSRLARAREELRRKLGHYVLTEPPGQQRGLP